MSKYFSVPLTSPIHAINMGARTFGHINLMVATASENPTKFAREHLSPLFMEMVEFVPYRAEDASGRLRLDTDVQLHESVDVMGTRTPWISVGSKPPVEIAFMNSDHILELYNRVDLSFAIDGDTMTISSIEGSLIAFSLRALGMPLGTALVVYLALGLYISLLVDKHGE